MGNLYQRLGGGVSKCKRWPEPQWYAAILWGGEGGSRAIYGTALK